MNKFAKTLKENLQKSQERMQKALMNSNMQVQNTSVEEENFEESDIKQPPPKRTFQVNFTINELIHLRDLFSIKLPSELSTTVSQDLATHCGRQYTEAQVWQKVARACDEASICLDDEGPDFTLGLVTGIPKIKVIEISPEPIYEEPCTENDP